jgi:hypothetical protein
MNTTQGAIGAMGQQNFINSLGQVGVGARIGNLPAGESSAALGQPLGQYDIGVNGANGALVAAAGTQAAINKNILPGLLAGQPGNIKAMANAAYKNPGSAASSAFANSMNSGEVLTDQTLPGFLQQMGVTNIPSSVQGQWALAAGFVGGGYQPVAATSAAGVEAVMGTRLKNQPLVNKSFGGSMIGDAAEDVTSMAPGLSGVANFFGIHTPTSTRTNPIAQHALKDIQNQIGTNGQNLNQATPLAELYQNAPANASITEGGSSSSLWSALSNKSEYGAIEAGEGTITIGGKKQSMSSYLAKQKLSLGGNATATGGGKNGSVLISLGPGVAQLFQVSTGGQASLEPATQSPSASQMPGVFS